MRFLAIAVILMPALLNAPARAAECSDGNAIAAESTADSLDSWQKVNVAFDQYAACDDGAVGEGFSDSIVKLLANRWDQLPELQALIRADPKLEGFVIRHIDETADFNQVKEIRVLASTKCPKGSAILCEKITARIDSFAEEK